MPLTWRVLDRERVRSLRDYVDRGGGRAAHAARAAAPDEVISLLASSGLRGRGGAGFPTGTKWQTVAEARSFRDTTTVVVNAAEGEPGTFKDRALLRTNPYRVLEGAIIAAATLQTERIRIGIKGTFGREIDRLAAAIDEVHDAGWSRDLDIELVLGPSSYLFGEETALLEVVEGRQPFPRVTPPYRRGIQPADTRSAVGARLATIGGEGGAPALVDNVETLADVALIVEHGPEWFRELGTVDSPGTIVATVSGATRRSAVGEIALGTTLREAIELVGWGPRPGHEVGVVVAGTANALIPPDLLDTPLTYEAMRAAGTGLGSAGFIVFDETTPPAAVAAGILRFLSVESCGQCEPCKADGLQIAELLRRSLGARPSERDLALLRRRVGTVAVGARCNLAQQQAAVTTSLLDLFPAALGAAWRSGHGTAVAPVPIAPIEDLVSGRATLDLRQLAKHPDWSYGDDDSGTAPAARLGNTSVHVEAPSPSPAWPEWTATSGTEQPLATIEASHAAIDALIDRAVADGGEDLDAIVEALVVAVRTHVDVTRRVLFPMVRRVGGDHGDQLADAAEAQERALLRLVGHLERRASRPLLQDIGVALHEHAAIGEQLLEVLRVGLDPVERASLADGLATAQVSSTVGRLSRRAGARTVPARVEGPSIRREPEGPPPSPEAPPAVAPPGPPAELTAPWTVVEARPAAWGLGSLLVGVDGSDAALAALRWADRLAGRLGAEVVIANVFEAEQAELSPDEHRGLVRAAEARLRGWAEPFRGHAVAHRGLQLTGAPDRLLEAARSEGAKLLVVGTRGAGRRAVLHLGSLAHHLAHHTSGPLAIIPVAGAANDVDRIVLGVDGSSGSAAATAWCADLAAALRASVLAVCAVDPRPPRRGMADDRWRAVAQAAISEDWISPLRAAGVDVRTTVTNGTHPLDALTAAAAQDGANLVVVGTRGLSDVAGVRLGRLPLQLVHHTRLPVVLVPPGAG